MKKIHKPVLILVILISISMLTGCSKEADAVSDTTTLWVLTEQTTSDSMNYQAKQAAQSFEEEHKGVTVRIDILPTKQDEREIYLKQLRTQIMAGDGPDIYLLPTDNVLRIDMPTEYSQLLMLTQVEIEPLFPDVTQAMYNGVFADISSFYDADKDLNTGALKQDVMEAGVIDGSRYVLPLRYTMPAILTDPSNYADTGIRQDLIDAGIDELAEYALAAGDTKMAIGLRMPDDTTLLPELFDYEKGEMLITEQEIADYMRTYQKWYAMTVAYTERFLAEHLEELRIILDEGTHYVFEDVLAETRTTVTLNSFNNVDAYGTYVYHWSLEGFPLYADNLPGVLDQAIISKAINKGLEAQPMRNVDGLTVAEVIYYGAVGSGCENPALAYEFLRTFLTEDYQWDLVRPRASRTNIDHWNLPQEKQVDGMIENSWPVRTDGSPQYLLDTLQYQDFHETYVTQYNHHRDINSPDLKISNADMPILDVSIDAVRFPIYQSYEESLSYALTLLNTQDGTPTDVDIDELAKQVYRYLWWHLAEG